jgi:hypothetical protein
VRAWWREHRSVVLYALLGIGAAAAMVEGRYDVATFRVVLAVAIKLNDGVSDLRRDIADLDAKVTSLINALRAAARQRSGV